MSLDVELFDENGDCVFDANITHNLNQMADAAGIYKAVWRPDENGIITGKDVADAMRSGIADMASRPSHYRQFNSPNGWGLYEHFLPWLTRYLEACDDNPTATVSVSR